MCLALNFLQTRDPPILPTLQQQPMLEPRVVAGVNVAFDSNMESYKDFGSRNKSSLGELLFHFFRYYAHELDFERNVISVRLGRLLSKAEKSWHLLQDNRLSVEEPFNTSRNLANTADDTSMRGIHLELRRAFELIGEGKLEKCCEQFVYPVEEIKPSEHFVPPSARPVIPQLPTQTPAQNSTQQSRAGRNSARGGRNSSQTSRGNNARRSSNPPGRSASYSRPLPFQMTAQELQLQAQHQQHLLHDQLFQQYQYLQLQEQELRLQLHQQNLRHRGLLAAGYSLPSAFMQYASGEDGLDVGVNGQMNGLGRAPLSAPLYQQRFAPSSPYLGVGQLSQGVSTNPPSPRINSLIPDTRRFSRRTSVTQMPSGGALRAQSQPARAIPLSSLGHLPSRPDFSGLQDASAGRRSSTSSNSHEAFPGYLENGHSMPGSMYDPGRRPAEYVGYYVGQSPSLSAYPQSTAISPIPSHVGLAIQNGGLSPRLPMATRPPGSSRSPSFQTIPKSTSETPVSEELHFEGVAAVHEPPKPRTGPLIVDGSVNSPRTRRTIPAYIDPDDPLNFSASTSEDLAFDTPSSSDEQSQDAFEFSAHERSPPRSPSATRNTPKEAAGSLKYLNGHLPLRSLGSGTHEEQQRNEVTAADMAGMTSLGALKKLGTAWPLDRQLSSVEEVRTPSPRVERFDPESQSPRVGGPLEEHQIVANGPSRTNNSDGSSQGSDKPLASITNGSLVSGQGLNSAVGAGTSNSWQTQKKRRKSKKTVKSENDVQALNTTGGESLPADDSLRKGG